MSGTSIFRMVGSMSEISVSSSLLLDAVAPELGDVEALISRLFQAHGGSPLCEMALGHLQTGGKRLRARLALATVSALGGVTKDGVGWAAACETLHNATLVHDDIQDGDRLRRGKPTVWAQHGVPQAINVGDLYFLLPFLALLEVPRSEMLRMQLCRILAAFGAGIVRGQGQELRLTAALDVTQANYFDTIDAKTSGLFMLPVHGAALIAGLTDSDAAAVAAAFGKLGLVFQMQDDVLDMFGDKGREAPGADIREGKVSALVVQHLTLHPEDHAWLTAILRTPRDATRDSDVVEVARRFRDEGALAATCAQIRDGLKSLEDAPVLARWPAMLALAQALGQTMVAPIAAVLARYP